MTVNRASVFAIIMTAIAGFLATSAPAQPEKDLKKTVRDIAAQMRKAVMEKKEAKDVKELAGKTGKESRKRPSSWRCSSCATRAGSASASLAP